MTRNEAIEKLPVTYKRAIALLDAGFSHRRIADELDVDEQAIEPLLAVAAAKLQRLMDAEAGPFEGGGPE